MDCSLIEPELIGFHFGTLDEEGRAAVESHLVSCARCVRAYLDTKRAIEVGASGARPSEASRGRLRAAVAAELASRRRRVATVSALAVAATIALVLAGVLARPPRTSMTAPAAVPAVDSARTVPASLDVL